MSTVGVRAHAKINLELRITGASPDGFHDLETVFQTIELHDTLWCEPRPGPFELSCDTPGVPLGSSNLAWRAATALWQRLGRPGAPLGVTVRLEKRIPAEAGLGGGSADAAAALVGLARAWGVAIETHVLGELAAALGSDVPFFLTGGTAIGRGRGERIRPLPDLASQWVVLVHPAVGVSTAAAYRWYDADGAAEQASVGLPEAWTLPAGSIRNDLEGPAVRRRPEIGRAKADLLGQGARTAGMTGSGSVVFGLFEARPAAEAAEAALSRAGWRTILTRTLDRAEHERRWLSAGPA